MDYGQRPWNKNTPTGDPYYGSSQNEQDLTAAALAPVMGMSDAQIRKIRPVIPITLFPKRFGYNTDQITIYDIGLVDQMFRRVDFSGRSSGYSGSSYPSYNTF